jgi:hypothetical protein
MEGDPGRLTVDESPPESSAETSLPVRVVAERPATGGPPWRYQGDTTALGSRFDLVVMLDANGSVDVALSPDPPPGLADRIKLLVRAAWRHARTENVPPPRRIARWRAWRPAVLASPP